MTNGEFITYYRCGVIHLVRTQIFRKTNIYPLTRTRTKWMTPIETMEW